jgi:hypothetical protein
MDGAKMHEPKNTLAGASYNVKTSLGGVGWKLGQGARFP